MLSNTAQPGLREPISFGKNSFRGLAILFAVVAVLAIVRRDLALTEWNAIFRQADGALHIDWLLSGLGLFFLLCAALNPQPFPDLATLAAGFLGGTIIEIWGTRTGLWHYYTGERPPLWILPAWSMSALANERLQRILLRTLPEKWRERTIADFGGSVPLLIFYRVLTISLFTTFLLWSRPALFDPYTIIVAALILASIWNPRFPLYALSLLACGALLGIFLEIWGTTRHCWNYYDGKTPSPFPIFGHGMAGLSFWKLKEGGRALLRRLKQA